MPKKTRRGVQIAFEVPRDLRKALEERAARDGRTLSAYIRRLCAAHVQEAPNQPAA